MINIDRLLNKEVIEDSSSMDTKKGLTQDLIMWSDKFLDYLKKSTPSKHTLRSYEFITSTLIDFSDTIIKSEYKNKNLSEVRSDVFNLYLTYLENFSINSEYGLLEYRLSILFKYVDRIHSCNTSKEFLALPATLENKFTIIEMSTFEYMISDFNTYMKTHKIKFKDIDNSYIQGYIDSIDTLSNKTMQQRKASLQAFLSFIDKSMKQEHFKSMYWEFNMYPLPTQNSKVKKLAFEEALLIKLVDVLHDYPKNINKYLVKIYAHSEYTAYKNTFMILIMMYGGCRASEALSIKYSDIIETQSSDATPLYEITVIGKGLKERPVYIKQVHLKEHLEYLLANRGANDFISGKKNSDTPLSRQPLFSFTKKIFNLAGSDKKGLHIFRHHFASSFVEQNGNIKILQELLDHSNITTTMIYSDISNEAKKDALGKM